MVKLYYTEVNYANIVIVCNTFKLDLTSRHVYISRLSPTIRKSIHTKMELCYLN